MLEKRVVLVTGAEGTIGKAVRAVLGERHEIVSLTREPQELPGQVGDIADLESIRPTFEGVWACDLAHARELLGYSPQDRAPDVSVPADE